MTFLQTKMGRNLHSFSTLHDILKPSNEAIDDKQGQVVSYEEVLLRLRWLPLKATAPLLRIYK